MQLWGCHYSWCEAPSRGVNLLLRCGRRSGTCCPVVSTPENAQLPASVQPRYAFQSASRTSHGVPKVLGSSRGAQHLLGTRRSTCTLLCICSIQKYYLSTSLLSSQLPCWKRHFLYPTAQKCTMLSISFHGCFLLFCFY